MKVEISRPLLNIVNYTKVDLPRSNAAYYEIYSFSGRGDFLSAQFKFNSEQVVIKIEIDGRIVTEVNMKHIKDLMGYRDKNLRSDAAINYNEGKKLAEINFGMPVEFRNSLKFFARANSTSNGRDLLGYQITHTTLEDDA